MCIRDRFTMDESPTGMLRRMNRTSMAMSPDHSRSMAFNSTTATPAPGSQAEMVTQDELALDLNSCSQMTEGPQEELLLLRSFNRTSSLGAAPSEQPLAMTPRLPCGTMTHDVRREQPAEAIFSMFNKTGAEGGSEMPSDAPPVSVEAGEHAARLPTVTDEPRGPGRPRFSIRIKTATKQQSRDPVQPEDEDCLLYTSPSPRDS
eukprot:TRINITY_DN41796_c0_g1_i1.p1 TRINITY_DN41796_c0_g1~~TRINITY_DN41796_c0_g1_i1.p1  ORF type:complete len:204 (+),score=44.04 TRINITY_DN41796_c0_g1_i1:82-693(+)